MKLGLGLSLTKSNVVQGFLNAFSLNFDSTNDYLKLASAQTLNKDNGSVSFWVKRDAIGANHGIFGHVSSTTINCYISTGGGERLYLRYGGNYLTSTTAIGTEWTHIVIVLSGSSSGAIYINGTPESSLVNNSIANNISFQVIGSRADSDMFFDGNIDEFAIWDTALDADAVTAIYNSGTPTNLTIDSGNYDNSSNLQGYWRMGDGTLDEYPLIADQTNATLGSDVYDDDYYGGSYPTGVSEVGDELVFDNYTGTLYGSGTGASGTRTVGRIYKYEYEITEHTSGYGISIHPEVVGVYDNTVGEHIKYIVAAQTYVRFYLSGWTGKIKKAIVVREVQGNAGLMTNMAAGDIEEDTP